MSIIGDFRSNVFNPTVLASQQLTKDLEYAEWDYVSAKSTESPAKARAAACAFVLFDKASHVVSQIGMVVEAAVKAVFAAYVHISYAPLDSDMDCIKTAKEMAVRCPLAALVCAVYVPSLIVTIPFGLLSALQNPGRYASAQINLAEIA